MKTSLVCALLLAVALLIARNAEASRKITSQFKDSGRLPSVSVCAPTPPPPPQNTE